MRVASLQMQQFRSYTYSDITFGPLLNVISGGNAEGKTTIIEALSLFAVGRSLRAKIEKDMIQFGTEESRLHLKLERAQRMVDLAIKIREKGKQVAVNQTIKKTMSDFLGNLYIVSFTPDDLQLVKGGPDDRRRFLNMSMAQFIPHALKYLHQYNQLLVQRNRLLKMRQPQTIDVWDQQISVVAAKVIAMREEFIFKLHILASEQYNLLSHSQEHLTLLYKSGVEKMEEGELTTKIYEELKRSLSHDLERGYTSFGPHRDDLLFLIDDRLVQRFGSQAQQRSYVLAIKLGLAQHIYKETGEYPILLLDDVLSELDQSRQEALFELIQKTQTILTTTDAVLASKLPISTVKNFQVSHGIITDKGA